MLVAQLLLTSLVGFAAASKSVSPNGPTCSTIKGSKPVKVVPTTTYTKSQTRTTRITRYSQNVITATPDVITSTRIKTAVLLETTTLSTPTDMIVATDFTTVTITLPASTITKTTTLTTDTTIQNVHPLPTGFLPVQESLQGSTYVVAQKDTGGVVTREEDKRQPGSGPVAAAANIARENKSQNPKAVYPQRVECIITKVIPKTIYTSKTKAPITITAQPSTSTVTSLVTVKNTKTIVPPHITVITSKVTSTIQSRIKPPPSTTTVTATEISAIVQVPPTDVPMCADSNFANSKNKAGAFFDPKKIDFKHTVANPFAQDVYTCCETCAEDEACIAFLYDGECTNFQADENTCSDSNPCTADITYDSTVGAGLGSQVGNGVRFVWRSDDLGHEI